jgi:cytochrome c-type biogenesis protein CcmH
VIGFFAAAAALVVAVLLLLLVPLVRRQHAGGDIRRTAVNTTIYRDEMAELEADLASGSLSRADFDQARNELQRRLLEDTAEADPQAAPRHTARRSALALGIGLPLAAVLAYFALGNLAALAPESRESKISANQVEDMVARLAARLEQNPDDLNGWTMLARSYKALGRHEEAVRAFTKAEKLVNTDAQLLSDYAEALALATGGSLKGRPTEILNRALALNPDHPQALVLAGTAAYARDDYAGAAAYWERLLKQLPVDSDDAKALAAGIEKARAAQKKNSPKPAKRAAGAAPASTPK